MSSTDGLRSVHLATREVENYLRLLVDADWFSQEAMGYEGTNEELKEAIVQAHREVSQTSRFWVLLQLA